MNLVVKYLKMFNEISLILSRIFLNVSLIFHFIFKHNHLHLCNRLKPHDLIHATAGAESVSGLGIECTAAHTSHIKQETGDEMRLKENQTRIFVRLSSNLYISIKHADEVLSVIPYEQNQ